VAYPPPPYVDAVTGAPVAGEAITGAWWAYPLSAGLKLGGYEPEVTALDGNVAPAAGLKLGAVAPAIVIDSGLVDVPLAGLKLGAYVPGYQLSTTLLIDPAGLLLGATVPASAGAAWLTPSVCTDLDLVAAPSGELVLVGAVASDLVLDPLECL
jgi:hypothetical protein